MCNQKQTCLILSSLFKEHSLPCCHISIWPLLNCKVVQYDREKLVLMSFHADLISILLHQGYIFLYHIHFVTRFCAILLFLLILWIIKPHILLLNKDRDKTQLCFWKQIRNYCCLKLANIKASFSLPEHKTTEATKNS